MCTKNQALSFSQLNSCIISVLPGQRDYFPLKPWLFLFFFFFWLVEWIDWDYIRRDLEGIRPMKYSDLYHIVPFKSCLNSGSIVFNSLRCEIRLWSLLCFFNLNPTEITVCMSAVPSSILSYNQAAGNKTSPLSKLLEYFNLLDLTQQAKINVGP